MGRRQLCTFCHSTRSLDTRLSHMSFLSRSIIFFLNLKRCFRLQRHRYVCHGQNSEDPLPHLFSFPPFHLYSPLSTPSHFFFPSLFLFAGPAPAPSTIPPGAPFSPLIPCISCIISFNILSLTPPPLNAGECSGSTPLIFHPFGTAGGGIGPLSIGIPCIGSRSGESFVVGCNFRCRHTSE